MQQLPRQSIPVTMRAAVQPLQRIPSHLHSNAVVEGRLRPDNVQKLALPTLDNLVRALSPYEESMSSHIQSLSSIENLRIAAIQRERHANGLRAAWSGLSRTIRGYSLDLPPEGLPNNYYGLPAPAPAPTPPRGAYLFGDVGCGKSMLMDLTFACAQDAIRSRARVHYHAFMAGVYQMIHKYDLMTPSERAKRGFFHPLDAVVGRLGRANHSRSGAGLLCFDEFQVADVADARLMHGILSRLMLSGTVVCFTANRAPDQLNRSQLQDRDFRPFLDLIYERCTMLPLKDGIDHRARMSEEANLNDGNGELRTYFDSTEEKQLYSAWQRMTGCRWDETVRRVLQVEYGRELIVKSAASNDKAVQMSVAELLEAAVGASDFRALASATDSVFITDMLPVFTSDTRNLARRFITLIDVCYEQKVRLFMRIEAEDLDEMFSKVDMRNEAAEIAEGLQFETEVGKVGVGADNREMSASTLYTGEDEAFAFKRAISRLKEMQTKGYGKDSVLRW